MATRIFIGDVREKLRVLPSDHYDIVVTSPPYWGLRDYGVAGQIGLEPTLGEHLAVMVDVFNAVRRVLKPSGTLWLNYGDCYATTPNGRSATNTKAAGNDDRTFRDKPFSTMGGALKPKDLCMLPNRLAIALQEAGWWVRSEIIWGKPNAMPDSSGRYRPSTAHEKIFLLAKADHVDFWIARDTGEISAAPDLSERCAFIAAEGIGPRWTALGHFYNAEAVRVPRSSNEDAIEFRGGSYVAGVPGPRKVTGNKQVKMPDGWDTGAGGHGNHHRHGREKGRTLTESPHGRHSLGDAIPKSQRRNDKQRGHNGLNDRWDLMTTEKQRENGRLLRNFEPAPLPVWSMATAAYKEAHFATFPPELVERCLKAGCPPGGRVLDPFGGAGTTALVADRFGLDCDLIELNEKYAADAERRIRAEVPMFAEIEMVAA